MLIFAQSVDSLYASVKPVTPRKVLSLDGVWKVEQGTMDSVPSEFTHTVVVPGLIDLSQPAFDEVGLVSSLREAFWYRRTFELEGDVPEFPILKVSKAKYGTKILLNGNVIGEHLPCFTPGFFDVSGYMRAGGEENELLIRVGAHRESLPEGMPTGWDFEKYRYIPGIYDSVELILSGAPFIRNVQTVPDIKSKSVKVVVEVESGKSASSFVLSGVVLESASGRLKSSARSQETRLTAGEVARVELVLPIENCRLWSPEDPFLYEVRLHTGGDAVQVRFGMRSFQFNPQSGRAILNGRPYFMRGSNVTVLRFFEDAERKDLPWNPEWVRSLHRKFKTMHWNSLRYCIGFPPEVWYDIADEEGLLIQDEFPIWLLGEAPENPVAEKIIPEYTAWMRERWNHPSVVIWDAQNESRTTETGKALQAVRSLDLSHRPWENGWAEPQSLEDCVESHPYLFISAWQDKEPFRLKEMPNVSGKPRLQPALQKLTVPIIVNEYGWLWLTREGEVTSLTGKVYESLLGPDSSIDQRRHLYARYLAALTEFWRSHREAAGVLHFCGLGYSRPGDKPRPEGGATSDHFLNLEDLDFEPYFEKYVRDAFSPVGLMLDFWEEELPLGARKEVKIHVINDLYRDWEGKVELRLKKGNETLDMWSQFCRVSALGRESLSFTVNLPGTPGRFELSAELEGASGELIRSVREFKSR